MPAPTSRRVALVTLGCARNDVDSSELAGRLDAAGWTLVEDAADADVAVVNTCGFIEQAKKDSVDALLEAADLKAAGGPRAVVAVGCLAERYGVELAQSLPEADAVLGFDSYPDLAAHLDGVLSGHRPASHVPRDRRTLLPLSPVERPAAAPTVLPFTRVLDGRVWAPVKLASGCDRRCAFCAIPTFRGAFLSRPPAQVLAEVGWLAERGVREVFLVSENTTSYGKDLADLRALESLLPRLAAVDGIRRVRVSYLQPAEIRPGLLEVIAGTDGVAAYFDISFQHAAAPVLRRMRRFGDPEAFLALLARVRELAPAAGVRTNVIVGFPGETEDDLTTLHTFLESADLDVVGVFGYSDEEGTEAVGLDGHLPDEVIADRLAATVDLVEQLTAQRAEDRVGDTVEVLVESVSDHPVGRAAHQGPEVDGTTSLVLDPASVPAAGPLLPGDLVTATVTGAEGVDLIATVPKLATTPPRGGAR